MAAPDPIITGVISGVFYRQPGSGFTENQWGFDEGNFTWETHVNTSRSTYPKVGDTATTGFYAATTGANFPSMYITEVTDVLDDSTKIVKVTAKYLGSMNPGAVKKERITPGVDISIFNLPGLEAEDGPKRNFVARVPKLRVTREYVTTTQPDYSGVSEAYSAAFLPALPTFTITFVPDPDQPQTHNYATGWLLDSREWEEVFSNKPCWKVRENISYYWDLAV